MDEGRPPVIETTIETQSRPEQSPNDLQTSKPEGVRPLSVYWKPWLRQIEPYKSSKSNG